MLQGCGLQALSSAGATPSLPTCACSTCPHAYLPQVSSRAEIDASVRDAVQRLLVRSNTLGLLRARYSAQLPAGVLAATSGASQEDLVELLMGGELPRPEGAALVDDWDCLRVGDECSLCLCWGVC